MDRMNYIREKYDFRDAYLRDLGYSSYSKYLASEDWKIIRSRILLRDPLCILCSCLSQVVHHLKYDIPVLLGLRDHVLVGICHSCHEILEMRNGGKNSLAKANEKFFPMARKTILGQQFLDRYYTSCREEKKTGARERSGRICNQSLYDSGVNKRDYKIKKVMQEKFAGVCSIGRTP